MKVATYHQHENATLQDPGEKAEDVEEVEYHLSEFGNVSGETCLQPCLTEYPVAGPLSTPAPQTDSIVIDPMEDSRSINFNNRNMLTRNEIVSFAHGERKHPVSLMNDKFCEELSFPVLLSKGRFGYKTEREVLLSPTKYFNARLLHKSGRFAINTEYLGFFAPKRKCQTV